MNINSFNKNIDNILNDGNIENIPIPNVDIIKNIIMDNTLNKTLFDKFKNNYNNVYGNDLDYFVLKIQDLLYRLHLLINHILIEKCNMDKEEYIYDAVFSYIINDSITLFDAVNYNDNDLVELEDEILDRNEELGFK